nr:hypothetical protein [Rhodococcus sp. (in: high G+C Gram-positive bacteria)]
MGKKKKAAPRLQRVTINVPETALEGLRGEIVELHELEDGDEARVRVLDDGEWVGMEVYLLPGEFELVAA